jgi:hypothetical protein
MNYAKYKNRFWLFNSVAMGWSIKIACVADWLFSNPAKAGLQPQRLKH